MVETDLNDVRGNLHTGNHPGVESSVEYVVRITIRNSHGPGLYYPSKRGRARPFVCGTFDSGLDGIQKKDLYSTKCHGLNSIKLSLATATAPEASVGKGSILFILSVGRTSVALVVE